MEKENRFSVGQTVYAYENWAHRIVSATIVETDNKTYKIKYRAFVDPDGKETEPFQGTSYRADSDLWTTAKEAYETLQMQDERETQKYMTEIKTVKDLVLFPLDYCLNGEEYTNYNARRAYKQRAEELLGIEVNFD